MSSVRRITVSIPNQLALDIDYVHKRIGVSKSAFISSLLVEGVSDLRALLESLPDNPSPDDLVRFRGASAEMVSGRMKGYQDQLED